MYNFVGTEQVN